MPVTALGSLGSTPPKLGAGGAVASGLGEGEKTALSSVHLAAWRPGLKARDPHCFATWVGVERFELKEI